MKLRNLNIYELQETGELKHIGGNQKINIKNRFYTVGDETASYEIKEYEHLKHTDYTRAKVTWPYTYRLKRESSFRCELCVKLNRFQALKYRLMFVSGKTVFRKAANVLKYIIKVITA